MEQTRRLSGKVISVNVGKPREVEWRGQNIRTAIWKSPVQGRVMARKLNLDGDGQADLIGHGGENRAMLIYQLDSYHYWQQLLKEKPYEMGWFGENLTVEGLPDSEVCVGDRFRIGEALVEVTQPRVTCYRLGIRTGRPEMPSLVVQHGRPGFYVRILEEGTIGANDPIELVTSNQARMSVTSVDQLLYLGKHPTDELQRALSIDALSEGWKGSFRELLNAQHNGPLVGNPGLSQDANKEPWQGFKPLVVLETQSESPDVQSIVLGATNGEALPVFIPGQHIVLKTLGANGQSLIRTYSLSGSPTDKTYRISIKREPGGAGSGFLQNFLRPGTEIEISAPRGTFTLDEATSGPVVLMSAGIGVTPVLSMLHALGKSDRQVYWIHAERDGDHLCFRNEIQNLMLTIAGSKRLIAFSQPTEKDVLGRNYDQRGRLDIGAIQKLGFPKTADFYLCGPLAFLDAFKEGLGNWGVFESRIHIEFFGAATPSKIAAAPTPPGIKGRFQITLTRSNRVLNWADSSGSLLELMEAGQVPVRWSCRVGVCHTCELSLLDGNVEYSPAPLDPPAEGRVLTCCARPTSDLALDV
jgi:ferredoxin-NADP reductase/MOSC domain-containing protein YiiM